MLNTNTQLVELIVPGATGGNQQTRIQFVDQPYLRGTFTESLETYTITDTPLSPSNLPVITAAVMQSAYLSLFITDPDKQSSQKGYYIQNVPLVTLHTLQNSANEPFERLPFMLRGQEISWDKCYLQLGAAIGNTSPVSFLFNVGFRSNPNYTAN